MAMMQIRRMPHHDGAEARGPVDLVRMATASSTSGKDGSDLSRLAARGRRCEAGWRQRCVTDTISRRHRQHFVFFLFSGFVMRDASLGCSSPIMA
jgi:hypothetical protein